MQSLSGMDKQSTLAFPTKLQKAYVPNPSAPLSLLVFSQSQSDKQQISYFTPAQDPPSGTASDPQPDNKPIPKIFQPLTIRGTTFQNRIFLSPLCQYSSENGHFGGWQFAHLGGIISRGPGLSIIEATAVVPEGRITPEDAGIWDDSHLEGEFGFKKIVEFAHSQSQKIGIQLAHAGRKASTVAPWLSMAAVATEDVNGWPSNVKGPSNIPHSPELPTPIAMTLSDIDSLKKSWAAAVRRAVTAGFDVIEIHNAHGYLLHSFLSPVSNDRTDQYGGSFENRIRLTLEIVDITRKEMPKEMPLFLRLSASDWLDTNPNFKGESWTLADSIKLAPLLVDRGVDFLDVSSSGNSPLQKIKGGPGYQAPFAKAIKKSVGDKLLVGTVGSITGGEQAEALLTGKGSEEMARGNQELDAVLVGRYFQKEPGLVWRFAEELGVQINVANQIRWGFGGRPGAPKKEKL
ncbi:hypothetical protein PZA11_005984 [Diplocarpon coronariae]|uniref:NADH:flavin oxidoreductase/NADH oxidase N-terminal domain-containing protein n=1 Tax=Diplocarpon coronariae TaxID=2795749 RepID=A0A218YVS5_9HELO|nr:hypothetical protein B2J93_1918 [Marssonina coronariae]